MRERLIIICIMMLIFIIIYDLNFIFNFEKIYKDKFDINFIAEIISLPEEKDSYNKYIVKTIHNSSIKNSTNTKIIAYINKNIKLVPGDIVKISGEFNKGQTKRNYGGFDYRSNLKQKKIYGIVYVNTISVLDKKIDIYSIIGTIKNSIINKTNLLYKNEENGFLKSILLGESEELDDEIKEYFRKSSLSHILAISGMHISYIVLAFKFVLEKTLKRKKLENRIIVIFLMLFSIFTGLKPSCIRACFMYSFILICENIHIKNSVYTNLLLSFIILILLNPYNIFSVGMWLSFMGTIGIILFSNLFYKILKKRIRNNIENKYVLKAFLYVTNLLAISFSAQILIIPIMIYVFNTISLSFFISNIFSSLLIGLVLILGFLSIIISYIFYPISKSISYLETFLIKLLIIISKQCSQIPLSNIKVVTPNIILIIIYYLIIVLIIYYYNKKRFLFLKMFLTILKIKETRKNKNKIIIKTLIEKSHKLVIIICILLLMTNLFNFDRKLNIYFVDVGQGDCTVIKTPSGKIIIIDGGDGGNGSKYDYGKNVVLPYLLDRKINKIDYLIISHFDSDHVGGLLTIIKEFKIDKVLISKQGVSSENFEIFKNIVKEKKVIVMTVGKGDVLKIEKDLYLDILWPNSLDLIEENVLNNNSIVCKLRYKNFSILFTGDIEEIAEKRIIEEYNSNLNILNSAVLKAGHHGSKTSSTQNFIEAVNPQIVLIGVGENNKFGHPNESVIERLELLGSKIFRTDKMGEIIINVDSNGRIKIKKQIEYNFKQI